MRTDALPDTYVRNAKKEEVNAALTAAHLEKDKLRPPFTPVVVNTGSKLVVIDTGLGPLLYEQSKGAVGQFQTNLAAAGIDRNAVDVVMISHFHGDHINGLLTARQIFRNGWPPGSLIKSNLKKRATIIEGKDSLSWMKR